MTVAYRLPLNLLAYDLVRVNRCASKFGILGRKHQKLDCMLAFPRINSRAHSDKPTEVLMPRGRATAHEIGRVAARVDGYFIGVVAANCSCGAPDQGVNMHRLTREPRQVIVTHFQWVSVGQPVISIAGPRAYRSSSCHYATDCETMTHTPAD